MNTRPEPAPSLITIVNVTYALHALGLAIGAFGAASVVGSFLFGWPSIVAVIINYVTGEWRDREQLAFPDEPVSRL